MLRGQEEIEIILLIHYTPTAPHFILFPRFERIFYIQEVDLCQVLKHTLCFLLHFESLMIMGLEDEKRIFNYDSHPVTDRIQQRALHRRLEGLALPPLGRGTVSRKGPHPEKLPGW